MSTPTQVQIVLDFYVKNPEEMVETATAMYQQVWNGQSLDELGDEPTLVLAVIERLLNSNPRIPSYDEFGLELTKSTGFIVEEN